MVQLVELNSYIQTLSDNINKEKHKNKKLAKHETYFQDLYRDLINTYDANKFHDQEFYQSIKGYVAGNDPQCPRRLGGDVELYAELQKQIKKMQGNKYLTKTVELYTQACELLVVENEYLPYSITTEVELDISPVKKVVPIEVNKKEKTRTLGIDLFLIELCGIYENNGNLSSLKDKYGEKFNSYVKELIVMNNSLVSLL